VEYARLGRRPIRKSDEWRYVGDAVRFVASSVANGWLIIAEITGKTAKPWHKVCAVMSAGGSPSAQSSITSLATDHRPSFRPAREHHIAYPGLSPNHDVGGFRMTPFNRASSPGRF